MPRPLPSQTHLLACLHYNPTTGDLTWLTGRCRGKVAGTTDDERYRSVKVDDVLYLAHRLIFKMMTGEDPPETVDHHDRDLRNNRWKNLRPASSTEQNRNQRTRKDNKTGHRGVFKRGERYRVQVGIDGVYTNVGTFDTLDAALEARRLRAPWL